MSKKDILTKENLTRTQREYKISRISQLKELEQVGINPYPHYFPNENPIKSLIPYNDTINPGDRLTEIQVSTVGRVTLKRWAGKKLLFYTIESDDISIQIMSDKRLYTNDKLTFKNLHTIIRRGDIIGIMGFIGKSKRGELSIFANNIVILAPCFHMLPKEHYGLVDIDIRTNQRYLDLILNKKTRNTFRTRSKIISYIRRFLDDRDFMEIETPILDIKHGGATAKPFTTYHNDLKQEMFLRIAPELKLKELVVGGLNKVYEIGKQFRNEGIDGTHNPEFTSIELYCAYNDYRYLIDLTQELLSSLVHKIFNNYMIEITVGKTKKTINFNPPFQVIDMLPFLSEKTGIIFSDDLDSYSFNLNLQIYFVSNSISLPASLTTAKLIDKLVEHYIEPECWNPTFIIHHPTIMSPLAKTHRDNPLLTERFELYIAGMEICNAYTELNDPFIQLQRFMNQQKDKDMGDDEAHGIDMEFIKALEYGLPPTAGWGMGIDRLCMLLTDNINSIKEVILFPTKSVTSVATT